MSKKTRDLMNTKKMSLKEKLQAIEDGKANIYITKDEAKKLLEIMYFSNLA